MFTIERSFMTPVIVMLMENTIRCDYPENLFATFDLKGSTHGRRVKGKIKPNTVQKDLDFL